MNEVVEYFLVFAVSYAITYVLISVGVDVVAEIKEIRRQKDQRKRQTYKGDGVTHLDKRKEEETAVSVNRVLSASKGFSNIGKQFKRVRK